MVAGGGIGWAMPAASRSKSSVYFIADGSGTCGKNFLRRRNLFHRTGEAESVFSRPASDVDLDGFQATVFHSQAELFIDFPDTVLLEAFAHH